MPFSRKSPVNIEPVSIRCGNTWFWL